MAGRISVRVWSHERMKPAWTVQFSQCGPVGMGMGIVVVVVFSSGSG